MSQLRHLVIPLILAFSLVLSTMPSTATADNPSPTPVATAPTGGSAPIGISLPDPRQWAADVFNQVLVNLLNGVASAVRGVVSSVLGSSLNFITQTPPAGSYASPTVVALWGIVRGIADAALQ